MQQERAAATCPAALLIGSFKCLQHSAACSCTCSVPGMGLGQLGAARAARSNLLPSAHTEQMFGKLLLDPGDMEHG